MNSELMSEEVMHELMYKRLLAYRFVQSMKDVIKDFNIQDCLTLVAIYDNHAIYDLKNRSFQTNALDVLVSILQ